MKFTIDRFEGELALVELEDKEIIAIPTKVLPKEAEEGDIIVMEIDEKETEKKRARIEEKFRRLLKE